jgi:hypothetical protein
MDPTAPAATADAPAEPKAEPKTPGPGGFDADAKAAARESSPVTIGGTIFYPRRKDWDTTRALRKLLRQQERCSARIRRVGTEIEALPSDTPESKYDELEAMQDRHQDEADEAAYGIIALLCADDAGKSPSMEHLKKHLDVVQAGDLASWLAGGGEPDPTETTPSS